MRASQLIRELARLLAAHGDLPIYLPTQQGEGEYASTVDEECTSVYLGEALKYAGLLHPDEYHGPGILLR